MIQRGTDLIQFVIEDRNKHRYKALIENAKKLFATMTRGIPIKIHAVLDYGWSLVLIAWAFLMPLQSHTAALILIATGIGTIFYSLFTAYELGPIKLIPFNVHIVFDALIGLFMIASPWLFDFYGMSYLPHLIFGLIELAVVIMTVRQPVIEIKP